MATPRRLVATECCAALAAAGVATLALGVTPLALAMVGVCAIAMAPALVATGRLERRSDD
jgi:Flp pilus assembly protein TadB